MKSLILSVVLLLCFFRGQSQSGSCGTDGVYINFEDWVNYDRASGGDLEVDTAGNLEIGPLGRYDVYGALLNKGTIIVDSGGVLTIYGDVTNNDSFMIYKGAVVHFYGKTWKNGTSSVLSDQGVLTDTLPRGVLTFTAPRPSVPADWVALSACLGSYSGGNALQYIDGRDIPMNVAMTLMNPNNVMLVNTTTRIEGKLVWAVANADIDLGDQDLVLSTNATQEGFRQDRFAITSGRGHMVKENFSGSWIFPVGITDNDYTPAAIDNALPNTMHVLVQDYASSASDEGTDGPDANGMHRTWNIYADDGSVTATLTLQHNTNTDQPLFDDAYNFVTRWGSVTPNPTGDYTVSFGVSAWQTNFSAAGTIGNLSSTGIVPGSNMRSRTYFGFATSASTPEAYFSKSSDPSHPLPVQLISFTGQQKDCDVALEFHTGQENNIEHYQLMRSTDGMNFTVVATITPKGNNSTYTYLDKVGGNGIYLYRLAMTEPGGDYTNSQTISIKVDCGSIQKIPVILYPNPAGAFITVSGMQMPSEIRVIDMLGHVVLAVSSSSSKETIDVSQIAAAFYTVSIISAYNEITNIKFKKL